jgi:amino acid transporter
MLLKVTTGLEWGLGPSAVVIGVMTVVVAAFSIVGGRANAGLVTALAVIKVAPVVLLIALAAPVLDTAALAPGWSALGAAATMAMFSYAGFENLAIPAGEASNPQRDVPRALVISLAAGVVLLVGANAVAIGLVNGLSDSKLALADAAQVVMGPAGWWMIAVTAILAVVGSKAGSLLANSRLLQGLADQGDIAAWFGGRSKRYGTPATAVVVSSALVAALALSGTFQSLVVLAVGTRVLVYASVALSVVRLRARDGYGAAPAARFRMPLAPLMVGVVLAGCGGILATMTLTQGVALAAGLTLGLLLYAGQAYQRRRTAA